MTKPDSSFYKKFRSIRDSEVAHAPPVVREVWDYILREVEWQDTPKLKAGQTRKTIRMISEDLHWMAGCVKKCYTIKQVRTALAWLSARHMVVTSQTTSGIIITVCKYGEYNTVGNTAGNSVGHPQGTPQGYSQGILLEKNKEQRTKKEEKGECIDPPSPDSLKAIWEPTKPNDPISFSDFCAMARDCGPWSENLPDRTLECAWGFYRNQQPNKIRQALERTKKIHGADLTAEHPGQYYLKSIREVTKVKVRA